MVLKYSDLSLEGYFTLGDAVLSGMITEWDGIGLVGNKEILERLPFGRLIHEGLRKKKFLEGLVGFEVREWFRDYLQGIFYNVSYYEAVDSLFDFRLREEHLDKIREKWGKRFIPYPDWSYSLLYNEMLDTEIPEYPGQLPSGFSNAVKACNFFLNPYSEHDFGDWNSYIDTLLTAMDYDDGWLLEKLKEDLMRLGQAFPDNAKDITILLKNPKALVHNFREFSDFHDRYELVINRIKEIRELIKEW